MVFLRSPRYVIEGCLRFTVGRVEANISEAAIVEAEALESTINDSTYPDFLLAATC